MNTINVSSGNNNSLALTVPSAQNFITISTAASVDSTNITGITLDGSTIEVDGATNGQVLIYNSTTNIWENGDLVGGELQSAITVSNTDGAFTHVSSFSAGTTIESVLRQILEKYNRTTITLNSVSRALQNTDGTYPVPSSEVTSNETLEIGRGVRVDAFRISVGDSSQTTDDSVKFLRGSSEVETGFSDTTGTKTLTSSDTQDPGTITSVTYKASVVDDGGANEPDLTLTSGGIKFEWLHRLRVGSSTTTALADDAAAQTLFDGMTTAFDELRGESDFTVTATSGMDTASNYTWVAYPVSFGNLSEIQLGATDVLSDFESPVDKNLTNDYGVTTSYRFYRSTYDDAFSTGQVLTIKF